MLSAVLGVVTEDDDDAQVAESDSRGRSRSAPRSGGLRGGAPSSDKITDRQKGFVHSLLSEMGVPSDQDLRRTIVISQAKADVVRVSDLTKAQGKKAIDQLKAWHDDGAFWSSDPSAIVLGDGGDVLWTAPGAEPDNEPESF
jgi:hypothetical protein